MARLTDVSQQQRPVPRVVGAPSRAPVLRGAVVGGVGIGIGALGDSLVRAGDEIFRAARIEEDRVNTARAEEAYNEYLERKIDLTVGETGFKNVKGTDAIGGTFLKDFTSRLRDAGNIIGGALDNDLQRREFKRRTDVSDLQFQEGLLRHLAEQSNVHAQGVHEGTLVTAMQEAVLGKDNPPVVEAAQARIENSVDEQASRNSWPKEFRDATLFTEQSKVYETVVRNLIDSDPAEARERFALYKDKIEGTRHPGIEAALKAGGLKRDSQIAADKIMSEVDDEAPEKDFLSQSEDALEKANDITKPEKRDATVVRVTSDINVMRAQRNARNRERSNSAWETILSGGTFDSLPTDQLQALREADPRAVVAMQSFMRQRDTNVIPITSSGGWDNYYVLERMATDDPRQYVGLDLRNEWQEMGTAQRNALSALRRSAMSKLQVQEARDEAAQLKQEREQAKRITYATARTASNDLLESAGIETNPDEGSEKARRLAEFRNALFVELEELQDLQKGKATEEQVREVTDRLLKVHESNFFSADVLTFEAPIGEVYEAIPLKERIALEQALGARGQSLSRENVVRQWQRILRADTAKAARAVEMIPP